jgi:hypothetical protein
MASLKLNDATVESLRARAAAEGVSLEELVERLLRQAPAESAMPRISVEDFDNLLDQEATDTPGLPPDFSRADIYVDHD